ncbi:MAG: alpha/beta hydrolase [Acidimicrobiales bacterium]
MTTTRHTRSAGRVAAIAGAGALLVAACGSDEGEPAAAETTTTTAEATTATVDPTIIAEEFDIGDGKTLYLQCEGEGSPTILLEAGDESGHEDWSKVDSDLAAETRTCAYDRLGTGRSSAPASRGMDDIIGDLDALLDKAAIEGPFIFVGASGGGYLAVEMATRHPEETAGLVLAETPQAITDPPPDLVPILKCDHETNVERRDYVEVEHAAWDDKAQIGAFPVTVISNDPGPGAPPEEASNVEDQMGWLVLSPGSKQVVVDSGHDVPIDEPDLVIAEILAVLEAARAG